MGGIITIPYTEKTFNTFAMMFDECKNEDGVPTDCFVYTCEGKDLNWLEQMVDKMDEQYPTQEWLYSSPDDNTGHATEIPVLIQQRKEQLTRLRKAIGYYEQTEHSKISRDAE